MIHEYRYEELRKRWLILIALLLNLALLFILFIVEMDMEWPEFKQSPPQEEAPIVFAAEPPAPEPLMPEMNEVAALKPRASVFGATDEVADDAEFMPGMTDSATKFEDGSGDQAFEVPTEKQLDEAVANEPADTVEEDEIPIEKSQAAREEQKKGTEEFTAEGTQAQRSTTTIFDQQKKQEEIIQKLQQAAVAAMKPNRATKNNTGRGTKNASPIKRTMTFADLAKGFIESFKNEGEDWFERAGNENIRPSQKELKYLSYYQKLAWHLQNVCRFSTFDYNPQRHPSHLEIELALTINREGKLTSVKMTRGSGSDDFNFFALNIFKAPYEYPPIPQHLPEDSITIPFLITCQTERQRIRFSY